MKFSKPLIGLIGFILGSASFGADAGSVMLNWSGDNGYVLAGSMDFDSSMPVVSAYGSGDVSSGGIQNLSVSFYKDNSLLKSYNNVSGGVSNYDFLSVTFDTALLQVIGDVNGLFNVGLDNVSGDMHLAGAIGGESNLVDYDVTTLSTNPNTRFTVIPEPCSIAIFALGLAALAVGRRGIKA